MAPIKYDTMNRKQALSTALTLAVARSDIGTEREAQAALRNLRGVLQINRFHIGVVDDGTLHIASPDEYRRINIPRTDPGHRTWALQAAPPRPIVQPDLESPANDVIFGGGPDELIAMFSHRLYAYMAFGGYARYLYFVRIEPSSSVFETVATSVTSEVNAIYALPGKLCVVPVHGEPFELPL
jgi:hypothetical protein